MMEPIIQVVERGLSAQLEEGVLKACRVVGVVVDKERLVQALDDARDFYHEGFRDAIRTIVRCADCGHYDPEGQVCGFWGGHRHPYHFCGEGVRLEVAE